jgi:hypothetical protein
MNCPECKYDKVPPSARFCPRCGSPVGIAAQVDVRQNVELNLGNVIGVQTGAIHGDVYGGDVYQVQVYALTDAGRSASWHRFLNENTLPYRSLSPYAARDRVLFKGRDAEIEQVVRRIGEHSLLVIYGQVGVGKTSLLAAGVIPDLMQHGALVVHIQDYTEPTVNIRKALATSASQITVPLPREPTLPALIRAVFEATQGSVVLVFDQLEQFFAPPVSDEQRAALIEDLAQSCQVVPREFLRLIFVVREDTLGRMGEFQHHLPGLWQSPFQLLPLNRQQAQYAIEAPLAELNYPVSYVGDIATELLVPDLDELTPEAPGWIGPAQLQIVCDSLYQAARKRRPPHIDVELYVSKAKGADGIMAQHLETKLRTNLAGDRMLAEQVLAAMVSPEASRWVHPGQLPSNGAPPEQVVDVLERLVKAGILIRRTTNNWNQYTFASHIVATEVQQLAGPEAARRYRAGDEVKRAWSAWLARDALATRGQLRYLVKAGAHLMPRAAKVLFLLRSAVTRGEPLGPWLDRLDTDEGRALIRQLEEPTASEEAWPSSRSDLHKAKLLLGLHDEGLPGRRKERELGQVAWSAVNHLQSATRQTAALALTVLGHREALNRLDEAVRVSLQGWRRLWRKAELRGALADADHEIEKLNSELPPLDRIGVWLWRAGRRLFRDRRRLVGMILGGGVGAGLGLGFMRGAIAIPTSYCASAVFATYFFYNAILGAATALGIAVAESLLPRQAEETGKAPPIWRAPLHPDRLPAVLAVLLGALSFGAAHAIVAWINCMYEYPPQAKLLKLMGFVGGLGLSLALYAQPRAGWRLGIGRWLLRLGTVAGLYLLLQHAFTGAQDRLSGIAIGWGSSFYLDQFSRYVTRWPRLEARFPEWFDCLARLDAALVGITLTVGITAGMLLAAAWLTKWHALVDRVGD